jgi:SAM-dependent methyltransferase
MESPFDDPKFVAGYSGKRQSPRSINNVLDTPLLLYLIGLSSGKRVLEIGCGAGDLCDQLLGSELDRYLGIDISQAFISLARDRIIDPRFEFARWDANDGLPKFSTEIILSGLSLHFIERLDRLFAAVHRNLTHKGIFVFSVRHPIRTCNPNGMVDSVTWAVKKYFEEGSRTYLWHGATCTLYHRTLATWYSRLTAAGLAVTLIKEPSVDPDIILEEDMDHSQLPGVIYFKCQKIDI